ncbi:hypothetical protein [Amycolatopsis thermoflava]|uniref:hypothetical protein n=1 Tax=Amycolatopsis thermoflava TaxID=84480 RepID=UPI003D715ACD
MPADTSTTRAPGTVSVVVMVSTIGTGHCSCASIGSGPDVQTVAGIGTAVRARDAVDRRSGREVARARPAVS